MKNLQPTAEPHDVNADFRGGGRSVEYLDQINKASIVALAEARIVSPDVASRIAAGVLTLIRAERDKPRQWSADYLDYEPKLLAIVGADASRLHCGRSRQDISATIARMNLRAGLLDECDALVQAREALLFLAAQHTRTIVPAYTHGVQAQPTTFAHYLLAMDGALTRSTSRLRAAYQHVNQGPLGSAALTTSSFALDRDRLAWLLGFDGLVENAYDANHFAPVDTSLEVATALGIAAVQIGQFAQDLHAQYAAPEPWMTLQRGELVGVSSIMPQKRNPAALEQLRVQSSMLLGDMQAVSLLAHNVRSGMFDYRAYDPVPSARALALFELLRKVLGGLVVDKERALAEVHADYSTATEIADALLQRADVPFRIGHHFASALTDYGRSRHLALRDIPYREAARIYEAMASQAFPLDAQAFSEVTSPEYMVFGRRGAGGPQIAEVDRMLARQREELATDLSWTHSRRAHLSLAEAQLDAAVAAIADGATASFPIVSNPETTS
ncbi:lyase family protein [Variovorax sp. Sphag1AA]|uniref:lyase family protein n=1 Tax=Variovorax sp. Sphag1AA TaxID=2587027 RepID=UPI00161C1ED1|nr:lyase family protein [Variovorax sp. Sphag1AA]MBB3182079.1 argininosuccinate lyase [Variovorax sp. Sphag1AA]